MLKCAFFFALTCVLSTVVAATSEMVCGLDPKINVETWSSYLDEIGNIFGSACGRNRGIFVLTPSDGHTYGCAHFPEIWNVTDANGVKKAPAAHAVEVLDQFVSSVYLSTPKYIRERDGSACDFEAMSALKCGLERPWQLTSWYEKLQAPIRAVNIGGLFILSRWISPGLLNWGEGETENIIDNESFHQNCEAAGVCDKLKTHLDTFYKQEDFDAMKTMGLNTVRIPVGFWYFEELTKGKVSSFYMKPTKSISASDHPLTNIIRMAKTAGLYVILDLEAVVNKAVDNQNAIVTLASAKAIAQYVKNIAFKYELDNVILVEIGNEVSNDSDAAIMDMAIDNARSIVPNIPIMIPASSSTSSSRWHEKNTYLNTKVYHGQAVPDIASDTSAGDREKLYAHEKIACGMKSALHFETCKRFPTFIGEFSLATENCLPHVDKDFEDFGQCNRIGERAASPWWQRHLTSFAMRQIDTYETELGWAFWTYKLDEVAEAATPSAVYWSFRMAVAQGYINLASKSASTDTPSADACLHAPPGDFTLGDDTHQPTGAPVVYYWIPPMPTAAPTFEPTQPTSLLANPRWLAFIIVCVFVAGGVMFIAVRHTGGGYTAITQQSVEMGQRPGTSSAFNSRA